MTLAYDDRPFGADQFYGNFNPGKTRRRGSLPCARRSARTRKRHLPSAGTAICSCCSAIGPEIYTNHHAVESYVGTLRRSETLHKNVKLHYGAEFYHDAIVSNNLGNHQRDYGAGYVSIDVRALQRFSFAAGIRENILRIAVGGEFSPR